jgi:type IV pilus assembly protein PilQ
VLKKLFRKIAIALLLFMFSTAIFAENQEYITISVRNQEVSTLIKMIAKRAGVNMMVEKSVTGAITLDLRNMYFERALSLIAKVNGFELRKVDNTYIVGNGKKLAEGFDIGRNELFTLQFASPDDIKGVIEATFKDKDSKVEVSVDKRTNSIIVTGTKNLLEQIKPLIQKLDKPVPQVMIEAKLVEVSTTSTKDIGFNWGWNAGNAPTENGKGILFTAEEALKPLKNAASYDPAIQGPKGSIFGLGDFYRGNMFIQATFTALENSGGAKTLTNPKVATLNGEQATIKVGKKVVYSGGDSGPQEKDVGVTLKITPHINDTKYITMQIEPEVSVLEAGSGTYPIIGQRMVNTKLRVRDGGEVLIGGLIQETENNSEEKIPLLGDIPFLKRFFKSNSSRNESQQLIVLIKPHIIHDM